jgi:hypothetical protein
MVLRLKSGLVRKNGAWRYLPESPNPTRATLSIMA